ncbi:MAG: multiheme c-type cytochrome [Acidobacteriaceae bacterium]
MHRSPVIFRCLLAAWLASAMLLMAQQAENAPEQTSTQERLERAGWWPTKEQASGDGFVGAKACAQCHEQMVASQRKTAMARTLMSGAQSDILSSHTGHSFKLNNFDYHIAASTSGPSYNVALAGGREKSLDAPVAWAFGSGEISQVYYSKLSESWVESYFSYFPTIQGFAATPAQRAAPTTVEEALGRTVPAAQLRGCFSCHSTGMTTGKLEPERLIPGVSCEACHGPGAAHVAAMKAGIRDTSFIFNPKRLKPVDQVDFCGACHKTWVDVSMEGTYGVAQVRFPAYRLESSKCWGDAGDARLTCAGCHDPHKPLVEIASSYDKNCLSCHANGETKSSVQHSAAACPRATKDCATCHMPKYEIEDTHYKFTDHMIRVVKEQRFPG